MQLSTPRIAPVSEAEFRRMAKDVIGREVAPDEEVLNITLTYARHPALLKAQGALQEHLGARSTLPHRDHELVILRMGWRCRSEYEVSQHSLRGATPEDLRRIAVGPDAEGLSAWDALLIRTVDELVDDHFISDGTWTKLAERYTPEQLIDLVALIGRYWTVSVWLNTMGVQLEPGKPRITF